MGEVALPTGSVVSRPQWHETMASRRQQSHDRKTKSGEWATMTGGLRRRRYTREDVESMHQRWLAGETHVEIALDYGCAIQTVSRLLRGLPSPPRWAHARNISDEKIKAVRALKDAGVRNEDIAERLDLKFHAVKRITQANREQDEISD